MQPILISSRWFPVAFGVCGLKFAAVLGPYSRCCCSGIVVAVVAAVLPSVTHTHTHTRIALPTWSNMRDMAEGDLERTWSCSCNEYVPHYAADAYEYGWTCAYVLQYWLLAYCATGPAPPLGVSVRLGQG